MKNRIIVLFYGAVALWALGTDLLHAQVRPPMPVILISVDTLRADRLSSYGYRGVTTAGIDAMARGGTIFSQASSQAPLTLPSHVSLLTSTFPFTNGVRDNGEQVGANLVGLAGILKSRGYRTAAFVGGFVLDRRFGMDTGFDTYDSPFDLNGAQGADSSDLKRPADEVTAAAIRWVDANSSQPFFLFLHLFDLHTPYILPAAARARFPNSGYDAALSYADAALGRFWNFLEKKGLPKKALIIFLADHGESLGDHGERTHGFFVYQSTMRVPLIFHWPEGSSTFPARVDHPVSLLDVAPTILDFLGAPRPPQFQGRSLLEFVRQKGPFADREVYTESLYASNHLGCAPLLGMRVGRYKYIDAPKPELYDLTQDPGEARNIYTSQKANATPLARKLSNVRSLSKSPQAGRKTPSPEVVARLRSLGYLASSASTAPAAGAGVDPKDKIAAYEQSRQAIAITLSGKYAESVPLFESVLSKNPEFLDARNILGLTLQKLGRHDDAIGSFRKVLEKDSLNLSAHYNMAVTYTDLDRLDDAVKELEATLAIA
ncbi:MAG: sulfatase-like hydrolase/transferase, partial [Bryobacteraceae bacterium]